MQEIIQNVFQKNPAIAIILGLNILCFGLMAYDKTAAQIKKYRVPKKLLFTSAVCFGAIGGLCAMWLLNHKTRKPSFKYGFLVLAIIQAFLIYIAYTTNWSSLI